MIGFETTGNATATVFDNEPVLTTDPCDVTCIGMY